MRRIFSEEYKFRLWRKIWVALAQAQHKAGLISEKELNDLKKNQENIDLQRILAIEKITRHDVMAAIHEFSEKAPIGSGKIHLGATSMDIVDNADTLRAKEALGIIEKKLIKLILLFKEKIKKYAGFACMGYTHLQPAQPTTVGYRLAFYAQDLLINLDYLKFLKKNLKAKGIKGAVGTAASYQALLQDKKINVARLEKEVMKILGTQAFLITNQVQPRLFDFLISNCLAAIASSLSKFSGDLRILQSANFGEWSEPFSQNQVGSSAMPFKKNPITAENICSLARFVAALPKAAWDNASLSYLERTLDDSANRRIVIPEAFLAVDQILESAAKILAGLVINEKRIAYNLNLHTPFAATETILMAAVKAGANRQKMHETLRQISLIAWSEIQDGKPNPMNNLLLKNKEILKYLGAAEIKKLLEVKNHIGDAKERTALLVKKLNSL